MKRVTLPIYKCIKPWPLREKIYWIRKRVRSVIKKNLILNSFYKSEISWFTFLVVGLKQFKHLNTLKSFFNRRLKSYWGHYNLLLILLRDLRHLLRKYLTPVKSQGKTNSKVWFNGSWTPVRLRIQN